MDRAEQDCWTPREVARLLSLVEGERRYYQELMAALPVAAAVVGGDGLLAATNASFRRLTGISRADAAKASAAELLGQEDLRTLIENALLGNAPAPVSKVLDLPGGDRKLLRLTALPFRGWDDGGGEALLVLEDLDQARELVRRAKRPFAELLENIDAALWTLDTATMRYTGVSPRALELQGYPAETWKQQEGFWLERVHPLDREWVSGFYRQAISAGASRSCEYRGLTIGGMTVHLRDLIRFEPRREDAAPRIFGVTIETGGWRRARLAGEQSSRMAAVSRLAARVAHDCNNLLTILGGHAEELRQALGPYPALRENLAEILAAGERLGGLTRPLADFTRPAAAESTIFSVDAWLAGIEPQLRQEVPAATRFEIRLQAGEASIQGDPRRLAEALRMLAGRAGRLASPAARMALRSAVENVQEACGPEAVPVTPGPRAVIIMEDDGPAIPPEARERLFEPFARTDDCCDYASVWKAVSESGGSIFVSSPDRGGTLFTLSFPCWTGESAAQPETPAAEPPQTVLVVDDEPGIRSLIAKILQRHGFHPVEAGDGEEAMTAAVGMGEELRLLIADVVMPNMGGVELAGRLRALRPDLPVLFISGYLGDAGLRAVRFPEDSAFLQKPFSMGALMEKVKQTLGEG